MRYRSARPARRKAHKTRPLSASVERLYLQSESQSHPPPHSLLLGKDVGGSQPSSLAAVQFAESQPDQRTLSRRESQRGGFSSGFPWCPSYITSLSGGSSLRCDCARSPAALPYGTIRELRQTATTTFEST